MLFVFQLLLKTLSLPKSKNKSSLECDFKFFWIICRVSKNLKCFLVTYKMLETLAFQNSSCRIEHLENKPREASFFVLLTQIVSMYFSISFFLHLLILTISDECRVWKEGDWRNPIHLKRVHSFYPILQSIILNKC